MSKTHKTGGRLARRARSFKDDFLGRINQIRSPSGNRAASPCKNTKNKTKNVPETQDDSPLNRPGKLYSKYFKMVSKLK
ncbi:unnamed protein product [Larinioides sclopetarius]|uniref:Uncharacterized protein n=1 Tax=Larinioides sclopetarius TaxID=280406 RepID=A0AAV1ZPB8_9ARAC